MGKNESLETVVNKYNRLCARFRDLQQQTNEKQDKWKELESQYKIIESLTRELCELILAKDPKEMVLGEEYAWSKLNTRDIIQRSKSAFVDYNQSRTQLLREIQRQSEDRRIMVENLQTQIEQNRKTQERLEQAYADARGEDDEPNIDPETGEVSEPESGAVSDKARKRMTLKLQQAADAGNIDIEPFDEDEDVPQRLSAVAKMKILEENKDLSKADIDQQSDMANKAADVKLERNGSKITQAERKMREVANKKLNHTQKIMQVSIEDIKGRMNDRRWVLLEVIGSTGMCEASDIINESLQLLMKRGDPSITENGMRHELLAITTNGCVDKDDSVTHPIKSKFSIYTLSDVGTRLYIDHFGKDPVVSEKNILIANHDNLQHGFGIKFLTQIIESTGQYQDVSMDRKKNTVRLENKELYIPDVTAKSEHNGKTFTVYFEYERGTHKQVDFNIKLNKMAKVTRTLNIVCPNQKTAEDLKRKTAAWIESRGGAKQLSSIKVRIATLKHLEGQKELYSDKKWMYTFDLKHGEKPVERKKGDE